MQNICKEDTAWVSTISQKPENPLKNSQIYTKIIEKQLKTIWKRITISESFIEKKYMKNYNRGQIREKDVKGNEKELHENFSALRSSSTGSVDPGKCAELF